MSHLVCVLVWELLIVALLSCLLLFTVGRYYRNKMNVTWNEDESRVSYHLDTYYVFDRDKSVGDPKDYIVTTLNVPLLVSWIRLLQWNYKISCKNIVHLKFVEPREYVCNMV